MKNTKKVPIIGVIWKVTFNALRQNPVLFIPFCISGAVKLAGLLFIFLSIFYPLSIIFAPIIKTLWGEMYLHYPFNFNLMPKLFYYGQVLVYVLIDGLLSGIAVWMIFQINEGKKPTFKEGIKKVLPKYLTLAAFLLTIFAIVYAINYGESLLTLRLLKVKLVAFLVKTRMLYFVRTLFNFFVIVLVETLFAFAIPFAVLENKRFFRAIGGSLSLVKKLFPVTLGLVLIPTLVSLPFSLMKTGLSALMNVTLPEITFVVLGLSVVVAIFIDLVVTASLAFLFLSRKELVLEKVS